MSDFHERLDRASRGASPRPDALDRLRDRRHRHERHQRVTATVVGLAITVMLVGGGFALLNGRDDVRPGGTGTQPMYLGLWPERTLAEAQQVQSAVDSGDESQAWRTDPEEVAKRFVTDVMGWVVASARVYSQGDGTLMYTDHPSKVIVVQQGSVSCALPRCWWWMAHAQYVTVAQLVPGGNLWSVVLTQTMPLMRGAYVPGQEVDTNANLQGEIDPPKDKPVILGAEHGSPCSGGQSATLYSPYNAYFDSSLLPHTTQFAAFRTPDCGETGDGYIALVVGADVPFDPLAGGSKYIPALTMVSVQFVPTPPPVEPFPSGSTEATPTGTPSQTAPDVAQITCADGRTTLSTPEIRPQADGYHFSVQVQDDSRALLFHRPGSDGYSSTWGPRPAASWEAVMQLSVGDFVVSCHAEGPDGTQSEPGAPLIHLDPLQVPDETHLSAYLVQSGLLDRVMTLAEANEVPHPASIQAVVTTPNQMVALTNGVSAAHGPAAGDVVVVQVTGSFVCHTCRQRTNTPITGNAMYIEAKLGTSSITDFGILGEPLDLTELGTPVDISVPG